MNDNTFVFHTIWRETFRHLDIDMQMKVVNAILDYAESGDVPADPVIHSICVQIFVRIDSEKHHYRSVCNKRRAAANSRWEKEKKSSFSQFT